MQRNYFFVLPHSEAFNKNTSIRPSLQCAHLLTHSHFFIIAIITVSFSFYSRFFTFMNVAAIPAKEEDRDREKSSKKDYRIGDTSASYQSC